MKKLLSILMLGAILALGSCGKDDPTTDPVTVAFSSLTANGSASATTTKLTLAFDKAIDGLSAEDITLTVGTTGATKGTLSAKGSGVYELAVNDITAAGDVTVTVVKTGYTITPASKTVTVNAAPTNKTYITVAELRAKGEGTITDEVYVKASVISNKEGGNSLSPKNIVISDGEAGITVKFVANADYAVGTELELALQGAQLAKYEGLLQLNNFPNAGVVATGETKVIPAKAITAAELMTGNFESMYVAVADVEVVTADLEKRMVVDDKHTNIGIEALTGEEFAMFSASYSVFATFAIPQGSGTLKGIAGINILDGGVAIYQVAPQTASDFTGLIGDRFKIVQFGTPEYVGPVLKVGEAFQAKIVIPYLNATGLESYSISVSATGDAAAGLETTTVSKSLTEGNGDLEISISGTPQDAGDFTYVITGITGLTLNTIVGTVAEEDVDNKADLSTLTVSSAYKAEVMTTTGWVAENAAVQQGGDKNSNPMFTFIGKGTDKAICLNGKTSAVGKLTSTTLVGGCKTLSFKYGNAFVEANGVSLKIEIKQNGVIVKTFNLIKTKDEVALQTAYFYSVDVNVTDNFEILITNNSPSAADADKDCVSIFDITWVNNPTNVIPGF